jgi:hypothetical protein
MSTEEDRGIAEKVKTTVAMIQSQRSRLVDELGREVVLFRRQYDAWGQVLDALGEPHENADDVVARIRRAADSRIQGRIEKSRQKDGAEPQPDPGPPESNEEQGGESPAETEPSEAQPKETRESDPPPPNTLRGKALVLAIMRGESERSWTLEEIRKRAGCTASAVAQTLAGLKKEGAVVSPEGRAPGRGGALYYRIAVMSDFVGRKKAVPPRPRLPSTPHQEVDEAEVAAVVDTVNELPGRWLTADGVFERMHNPEAWHGGHQARHQVVLRIASALESAAGKEQLERSMDDDGRPTYRALGTKAPKEGRTPLQQGTRAKKKG